MKNHIDIGGQKTGEGFFLNLENPKSPSIVQNFDCFSANSKYGLHPNIPRTKTFGLKGALIDLIENAKNKLFVASFFLNEQDVIKAIIKKSDELKGRVFVITCLDEKRLQDSLAELSENSDGGQLSKVGQMKETHKRLTSEGVWLRGHDGCHAKFAVADDKLALVSTANFDEEGLNQNEEIGVTVSDEKEARRLASFFSRLWHLGSQMDMLPGQHSVSECSASSFKCPVALPDIQVAPHIIWTHQGEPIILNTIHAIIEAATQEIIMASWDVAALENAPHLLTDPLSRAIGKGVRCRLLVRIRNRFKASRKNLQILSGLGVEIAGDPWNHAKGIVSDRKSGAMFSANFDGRHGLESGVEVGVRMTNDEVLKGLSSFFEDAFCYAPTRFVSNATNLDLHDRLRAGWKSSWPYERNIQVDVAKDDWSRFVNSAQNKLTLFEELNPKATMLICGSERYLLEKDEDRYRLACGEVNGGQNCASDLINLWAWSDASKIAKRGICPAVIVSAAK